jgi:hypothetical protein
MAAMFPEAANIPGKPDQRTGTPVRQCIRNLLHQNMIAARERFARCDRSQSRHRIAQEIGILSPILQAFVLGQK